MTHYPARFSLFGDQARFEITRASLFPPRFSILLFYFPQSPPFLLRGGPGGSTVPLPARSMSGLKGIRTFPPPPFFFYWLTFFSDLLRFFRNCFTAYTDYHLFPWHTVPTFDPAGFKGVHFHLLSTHVNSRSLTGSRSLQTPFGFLLP